MASRRSSGTSGSAGSSRHPASISGCRLRDRVARVDLAGVQIDQLDRRQLVQRLRSFLRCPHPHQVVTINLDFLSIARRHRVFRDTIDGADLAVADGMPLLWASRIGRSRLPERITGIDLIHEGCRLALATDRGVFLLGAAPAAAAGAAGRLRSLHPGLRVDTYAPPFGAITAAQNERIVRTIRRAAPGFLFVALGAPRQDVWITENLERLGVPVAVGVGGALDILGGAVRRAPHWMQRSGLEWAFRLLQEPGRLWKRYLLHDVPMFARLMLEALGRRRHAAR